MKKMVLLLISLIFIYLIINIFMIIFNNGYNINYEIKNENELFNINEIYSKKERKNYTITIDHNDIKYSYQLIEKFNKKNIVEKIEYYSDNNIECILPIFNGEKIIFDITCYDGQKLIDYHNMNDIPDSLNQFKDKINIYDESLFFDKINNSTNINLYNIYTDNIIDNHHISFTNYKGITNIDKNKNVKTVDIFSSDKYSRPLSAFTKDYYVVANYDERYEFSKFYIVNLKNNSLKELKLNYKISFESYIQGIIDNSVYIFDKENKIQYKLDAKNMTIQEIGNKKRGIQHYENNKFSTIEINNAIKEKLLFKTFNREILDNGDIIDKINNKNLGYIYTYIKKDNEYLLYISNIQTPDIKKYLTKIKDINSIIYVDEFIYFKNNNSIKYYSEFTGFKTIIISEELLFNENILYNITK